MFFDRKNKFLKKNLTFLKQTNSFFTIKIQFDKKKVNCSCKIPLLNSLLILQNNYFLSLQILIRNRFFIKKSAIKFCRQQVFG